MSRSVASRLDALERAVVPREDIFAIRDGDDSVYSDCFGERRRYYTLAEWRLFYPSAKIVDFRSLEREISDEQALK